MTFDDVEKLFDKAGCEILNIHDKEKKYHELMKLAKNPNLSKQEVIKLKNEAVKYHNEFLNDISTAIIDDLGLINELLPSVIKDSDKISEMVEKSLFLKN